MPLIISDRIVEDGLERSNHSCRVGAYIEKISSILFTCSVESQCCRVELASLEEELLLIDSEPFAATTRDR